MCDFNKNNALIVAFLWENFNDIITPKKWSVSELQIGVVMYMPLTQN